MIRVLPSIEAAHQARLELARRGLDFTKRDRWRLVLPVRVLRRLGLTRAPFLPDPVKAWDVLLAVEQLAQACRPEDPILDLGCKDSEILPCLAALGFVDLHGIDLDPSVSRQPTFQCIQWHVGNLYQGGFKTGQFTAVTAISTIEHGIDVKRLGAEVSQLLRPDGLFIFSTDYHAQKLDTSDLYRFGMDWTIFSREEIIALLQQFERDGLSPVGEISLDQDTTPIRWMGRSYTFLFGVLRKRKICPISWS